MSESKHCDMCLNPMAKPDTSVRFMEVAPMVSYRLERTDTNGYYDSLDICSAECIAAAAVGEGHERGAREERDASRRRAPETKRRWWQRRTP